jgi:predicted Fe-Mo cluster-binding NifX family protein
LGFAIFEIDGTVVRRAELRANNHTPHAQGLCHGEHGHGHTHGHNGVLGLLSDCSVLLCGGIGAGAAQALQQNGIDPRRVECPRPIEQAVSDFLNSKTTAPDLQPCNCRH